MQKRKNIRLIVLLLAVITAIVSLQLTKQSTSNLAIDKTYFQLGDQQEITDIYLQGNGLDNHFSFKNGQWYVNDSLLLDQSMGEVFFSVLSRMEVRRPVAKAKKDSIADFLATKGVHTIISYADEIVKDYWVGGDKADEVSWIMDNEAREPYQIHLPGYQSYLAGIFYVPTNDWRSRFVFNMNFALIKAIKLSYLNNGEGFSLAYNNGFFYSPDGDTDSLKVAGFLDQVAFLQADRFLVKEEITSQYDSLIKNNRVFARLLLEKSFGDNQEVIFYDKIAGSPFVLAKTYDGSFCLFDFRRIKDIFKERGDFE